MNTFVHAVLAVDEAPDHGPRAVRSMLAATPHDSWDHAGVHVIEPSGGMLTRQAHGAFGYQVGHRRLAGLGHSHDPFTSVVVVADLELHNRRDIASALGTDSGELVARSDADLVAETYQRWGDSGVDRLLGDGAFVLWDVRRQHLLAWRDVSGSRPLYLCFSTRQAVLSSDLRSLTASGVVGRHLDLAYARAFSENESFQHPTRTMVTGVQKLAPGHRLSWYPGARPTITRIWDPRDVERRPVTDDRELVEELRHLTRESIACRIADRDTVVGAHLSGGLDSSSIAVLADINLRGAGSRLRAGYSWAPPFSAVPALPHDERFLAQAVATDKDLDLRFTTLDVGDVDRFIYRDIALRPRATLDFEFGTSRFARSDGVTTLLSGWGGDEAAVFNGRGFFADLARRGRLMTVHRELQAHAQIIGASEFRSWRSRVVVPLVPDRMFFWRQRRHEKSPQVPAELRTDVKSAYAQTAPLDRPGLRERPGVRRMQIELLEWGHLSYRMESWASHGADVGLLYRFPMLDRRLLEFALSVPEDAYFKDGWKRRLYRESTAGVLPDAVRWNPHKFDTAATQHLRAVRLKVAGVHRERLRARLDNPFVDVQMLLDAFDRYSSEIEHGLRPKRPNLGRAMWMAFVDLEP